MADGRAEFGRERGLVVDGHDPQFGGRLGQHDLVGPVGVLGEDGPQAFVPGDHVAEGRTQRVAVQRAGEPQ